MAPGGLSAPQQRRQQVRGPEPRHKGGLSAGSGTTLRGSQEEDRGGVKSRGKRRVAKELWGSG